MSRLNLAVAFAAVCLMSAGASAASVYRWVDTEGHVHYGDKPVQDAEPVNIRNGQPKGAVPLPGAYSSSTSSTTTSAQSPQDCAQKKKQYDSYKSASKIVETDSLGRQHEYTAQEQQQLVKKTEDDLKGACGSAAITTSSSGH